MTPEREAEIRCLYRYHDLAKELLSEIDRLRAELAKVRAIGLEMSMVLPRLSRLSDARDQEYVKKLIAQGDAIWLPPAPSEARS